MRSVDSVARLLGRLGRGASLAARTVLPVDTNPVPADWTHVTKVDPEEAKKLPLLFPLYLQHTDAVSVGGSADVTAENTEETFDLVGPASVPVFHEPSGPRQVTRRTREQAELLAIPEVLNGDSESLVGQLGAGTEYIREEMVPELLADELPWLPTFATDALADFATSWLLAEAVFEAYVVQNPDSAAARESNVDETDVLSPREAKQRAMAAERHLGSELVYVEYSGTYGGEEAVDVLDEVSDALSWSRLWYGGGLDSREHANAMLGAGADAIVVGDAFHRIADEEAAICARAGTELDATASTDAIREWVRENVAVADSDAAAYLATVPSVSNPGRLAERYLTATIRTWLRLQELSVDGGGDGTTSKSASKTVDRVPGIDAIADLGDDAELVRRYLRALLADCRDGVDADRRGAETADYEDEGGPDALPTDHFAVSLSSDAPADANSSASPHR